MTANSPPENRYLKLVGMHRAEFNRANQLYTRILKVQVAIGTIGIVGVFVTDARWTYILALVAVALAFWWAYVAWQYRRSRSVGERGRRMILLHDGLGMPISDMDWADLMGAFSVSEEEGERNTDPNYYATKAPPGPQRLAEMQEESAFWSVRLYAESAKVSRILFAFSLTLCLGTFLTAMLFMPAAQLFNGARVLCALLVLLISTDFFGSALAYMDSERSVERIIGQLQQARLKGFPLEEVFRIVLDYSSAVEGSPLYPVGTYDRLKSSIQKAWDTRTAGRVSS